MSYIIETTYQAEAEAEEAYSWMAKYSPEKAALWYFDLRAAVESLAESPARCPFAPERRTFKTETQHLIFGKYRILFLIEDEAVYILHVRHSARKPLAPEDETEEQTEDRDLS